MYSHIYTILCLSDPTSSTPSPPPPPRLQDKTEIVFAKKKIDMLHKDKKNKKFGADFKLKLDVQSLDSSDAKNVTDTRLTDSGLTDTRLSFKQHPRPFQTEGSEAFSKTRVLQFQSHSHAQDIVEQCFEEYGHVAHFMKGEYVLNVDSPHGQVFLISQGVVEGVVVSASMADTVARGRTDYHACGSNIPDGDKTSTLRLPINMVQV